MPPRLLPRPLGRTGLSATSLALAGYGGRISPEDVEFAFHELGINTFFVTPRMKALAEGVRRLVRAGHRDRIVLVTMGHVPFGWAMRRSFESIARSFGVDHLDVYLLGWIRGRWYVTGKTWPAMRALKAEGKVRAIGFSAHDRPLAARVAREFEPDVLMLRYNAAHRGAQKDVFEPLGAKRPAVLAYTATRWGTLLEPAPGFAEPMTAGECYRFAIGNPAVDSVLCGARSREELLADVAAVRQGALDARRLAEIERFGDAVRASSKKTRFFEFS